MTSLDVRSSTFRRIFKCQMLKNKLFDEVCDEVFHRFHLSLTLLSAPECYIQSWWIFFKADSTFPAVFTFIYR